MIPGYKMRTHLTKSLQTRCKAIKNTVDKYNLAARAIGREPLDWTKISHYSFLEEFTLLKNTRQDISEKQWTKPAVRMMMQQSRRIKRAKEEIVRCNIEIRRLHTSIVDEEHDLKGVLEGLCDSASPLYGPVREYWINRERANMQILARIRQIYALEGYSGIEGPGTRIGRAPLLLVDEDVQDDAHGDKAASNGGVDDSDDDDNDDARDTVDNVVYYISQLSVV